MIMKRRSIKLNYKLISPLLILLLLLPGFIFVPTVLGYNESYSNISVKHAYTMIKKNKHSDLLLLDVRSKSEYSVTHLYNALQLSLDDIGDQISEIEQYKENNIIVYCKSGVRSEYASEILVNYGFSKVYNMEGGIIAWSDAGFPVWSIAHNITIEEDGSVDIIPMILENRECGCTNTDNTSNLFTDIQIESTVLKENDTYREIRYNYTLNNTNYETLEIRSLLFSFETNDSGTIKSFDFYYYEVIRSDSVSNYYLLKYYSEHEQYKLSITTELTPSNKEFYTSSKTVLVYNPAEKTRNTI